MGRLRTFGVLASLFALLAVGGVVRADGTGNGPAVFGLGGAIPENAHGLQLARGFHAVDTFELERAGATRPLATRACGVSKTEENRCFAEPLQRGDIVRVAAPYELGARDETGSNGLRVLGTSPPPSRIGVLTVAPPGSTPAGCTLTPNADGIDASLRLEFAPEMIPWVDGARFRTYWDGKPWIDQSHVCTNDRTQRWRDWAIVQLSAPSRKWARATPGVHSVFIEARIAEHKTLRSNTVRITIPRAVAAPASSVP